jgi:hypothetical protein
MVISVRRTPQGGGSRCVTTVMTMSQDVVARIPYRCAVGLIVKTDEVSEQLWPWSGDMYSTGNGWCAILSGRELRPARAMRPN